jgi:hypothetical protein
MATERVAARVPSVPERRPAPPVPVRPPVAPEPPAERLKRRLGNEGTAAFIASAVAAPVPIGVPGPAGPAGGAAAAISARAPATEAPPSATAPSDGAAPATKAPAPAAAAGERAAPAASAAQPAAAGPAAPAAGKPPTEKPAAAPGAKPGKADAEAGKAPSPRQAMAPAIAAVRQRAAGARKHSPPGVPVASAQAAAITKGAEQRRGAAVGTVANLNTAKEGAKKVERESFKAEFKKAIHEATPKPTTEAKANEVVESGAKTASSTMKGQLATQRDAAAGPLKGAAATELPPSEQPAPTEATLKPEPLGPKPAPVSAAPVVPPPLPPERLDYSEDRAPTDKAMVENNISKEQLAKGNEPAFGQTLQARSTAEQHEAQAEAKYRKSEATVQSAAEARAQGALAHGLGDMQGLRTLGVGQVVGRQVGTSNKDRVERERITSTIEGIKKQTKADVEEILKSMETEASDIFAEGLAAAERAYRNTFEEEKGGLGTWLTTWGDDWKELIENSLDKARNEYLRQVDLAIDRVANCVDAKLEAAKKRVADGHQQVENFVDGLDKSVIGFGKEALAAVESDFEAMSTEINQRKDALVNTLTQQFKQSYERMSAMEEELRSANKSLWERVYDATVGLIKKILAFKDMLLSILAKAMDVIGDIISDPIGFLGNLISGVMLGLKNFMKNIGAHLKKGLLDWLFGALGGAGLTLPDTLDLKGIVSIVLQILGLTYANFRARAVQIVGEPVVAALEKTAEVFKVIITEGIPGLWRFIKEKVEDLKSMVLDAIFDFIKEKVIIAGVTWIIGLLNPASAFFKACKAIYDIVMFFINRGSQILALVNAVIDSVAAIVKGQIGVAAKWVEDALAKAIPVAIGFLASLLGLGDISGTIRKTIDKAQAPVNKAIDWVINGAVKAVKAAGKLVTGLVGGKKDTKEAAATKDGTEEDDPVIRAGRVLATRLGPAEHSPSEMEATVSAVRTEEKSHGLSELSLGKPREDGSIPVFAAASPGKEIGALVDPEVRPEGYGAKVKAQVSIGFESEKAELPPDERGVEILGYRIDRATGQRIPLTTKLPTGEVYDVFSRPQEVRGATGRGRVGGIRIKPEEGAKALELRSFNYGGALDPKTNNRHAEHQFVDYVLRQLESKANNDWASRITYIEVELSSFTACDDCSRDLVDLIAAVRKRGSKASGKISAKKWYDTNPRAAAGRTSADGVNALVGAGWEINYPAPPADVVEGIGSANMKFVPSVEIVQSPSGPRLTSRPSPAGTPR